MNLRYGSKHDYRHNFDVWNWSEYYLLFSFCGSVISSEDKHVKFAWEMTFDRCYFCVTFCYGRMCALNYKDLYNWKVRRFNQRCSLSHLKKQ